MTSPLKAGLIRECLIPEVLILQINFSGCGLSAGAGSARPGAKESKMD